MNKVDRVDMVNKVDAIINGKKRIIDIPTKYEDSLNNTTQMYQEIFLTGHYKKGLNHIKKIKNPVVVDLGANIGLSVLYFSSAKCKIYAIEPDQDYYPLLISNTKGIDVDYSDVAIAMTNGKRYLSGMSFYYLEDKSEKPQIVKSITFEKYLREKNIQHVDLLKIDIEGAEYEVFTSDGFKNVVDKIDTIIGEAHFKPYPCIPMDVEVILKSYGYDFKWLPFDNLKRGYEIKTLNDKNELIKMDLSYFTKTMFWASKKLDAKTIK